MVSLFDQAAEKLRQAMEGSATGAERMRLIEEAMALYHRHQSDEIVDGGEAEGVPPTGGPRGDVIREA